MLKLLDPEKNIFKKRFYRDSCIDTKNGIYIKDLRVIGRNLKNLVLVDNCAYSYCLQPNNGIPIIPFTNNTKDKQLKFLGSYL